MVILECPLCGNKVSITEIISNRGMCDKCFRLHNPAIHCCSDCGVPLSASTGNYHGLCSGCMQLAALRASQAQAKAYAKHHAGIYGYATPNSIGGNPVATGRYGNRPGGPPPSGYGVPGYPVAGASKPATQCTFTWDVARGAYKIDSPYQVNFIEFIKAKVPVSDRVAEYDPITRKFKAWFIKEAWYDILYELASQLWPNAVDVVTRAQAEEAWRQQEAARAAMLRAQREAVLGPFETALLAFCEQCDEDALKAAYRKAAISLHPDKQNGDTDKMARLNASWFIIEQEFKKRSEAK